MNLDTPKPIERKVGRNKKWTFRGDAPGLGEWLTRHDDRGYGIAAPTLTDAASLLELMIDDSDRGSLETWLEADGDGSLAAWRLATQVYRNATGQDPEVVDADPLAEHFARVNRNDILSLARALQAAEPDDKEEDLSPKA